MTDPFTEWRGKEAPYWTVEQSLHEQNHLRLLQKMEALQRANGKAAKQAPHPLARSWHD